ncbi:MAG: hypothetical protein V4438_04370 [Patescibacteria group bacterium]
MKNKPFFKEWEATTNQLAEQFALKYFGKDVETYWIADEIGGVYSVADYFFNVNTMADFLRYNYTRKSMFEYYDYHLKCLENKESPINIKAWRHLKK